MQGHVCRTPSPRSSPSRTAPANRRHGLKLWIEAAKKRLHHNVFAIALANKLARIAWSVLASWSSLRDEQASGCCVIVRE
jgi:hypothetical protein